MVEITKDKYVSSSFESYHSCIISFDLWMSRAGMDTFVMIVHFLSVQLEPCHITVGFFEVANIIGSAMALQVNAMLAKHGFIT
jgi:hypothetical protein